MNHKVLARKWRPQIFSEVIGQEHVIGSIINGILAKRIHHAYLFSGMRGVGKTTIARLLTKALNCEYGIVPDPCGKCIHCLAIEKGFFADLFEIDAASRTKVEDTKDLLDSVQYMPVIGRFKVYLIDEVHMLSKHSFNALLKTLEEPPMHVKFFLASSNIKKIPITILSRCFHFHLKPINDLLISNQLAYILEKEKIEIDSYALKLLSKFSKGSMRDALTLTDQAIVFCKKKITAELIQNMLGILDSEEALILIEALVNSDSNLIMKKIKQYSLEGIDWDNLLIEILSFLHLIAMNQLETSYYLHDYEKLNFSYRLNKLSQVISPTSIQSYYQIFLIGRKELPYAPNHQICVEITLLRALAFSPIFD